MHVLKRKATKHNGGPAFPFGQICETTGQPVNGFYDTGMTLRDYFAAKAMQGLLSGFYRDTSKYNFSELPTESYSIADAMLSERNK